MTEGEGLAMTQKRWGISPTSGKSKYPDSTPTPLCHFGFGLPLVFGFWHLKFGMMPHLPFSGIFSYNSDKIVK